MTDRTSYLVQRLERPRSWNVAGVAVDNPFAFGGGYKNGGLSDDAMSLLRELFSFSYMGSAEYEFGAVPRALNVIAKHAAAGTLATTSFGIHTSNVAPNWQDKGSAPDHITTIDVIAPEAWLDEVESRIREMAQLGPKYRAKEAVHLDRTLRPYHDRDGDAVGWLELDNGYMFFVDRHMSEGVAQLFGLTFSGTPHNPPLAPPTREEAEVRRAQEKQRRRLRKSI